MTPSSPAVAPASITTEVRVRDIALALLAAVSLAGCDGPAEATPASVAIGDPFPELTPEELDRFQAGKSVFSRIFTPEAGLGPRFNENACNACHTDPADGGTGEQLVIRASRVLEDGSCDIMSAHGGENLRRLVTPELEAVGGGAVPLPEEATATGRFTTPFLFGVGLVDLIPAEAIEAGADPEDLNGDGISGRVGRDGAGREARFGRKASVADLGSFTDEAFRFEMGVTTPAHPSELEAGGVPEVPEGVDLAPEPEVDAETLRSVLDFLRFLAPPAPHTDESTAVRRGRELFNGLGCATCHTPLLRTGPSDVEALRDRPVHLYSDLLLHDMGPDLAGPCGPGASPTEWRTEPLMGLRWRSIYLHDGRAGRLIDAVLMHGGEATRARDAFADLDRVTQEHLVEFLRTL